MKFLFPFSCAFLLAACVAPQPPAPGTNAHQQLLAEQARENFYAMKNAQRKSRPQLAAPETPARRPPLKPFRVVQETAPKPPAQKPRPPLVKFRAQASPKPVLAAKSKRANAQPAAPPKRTAKAPAKLAASPKPKLSAKEKLPASAKLQANAKPRKSTPPPAPVSRHRRKRLDSDTVYYYQELPRSIRNSERYRSYEAEYARSRGKTPAQLSPAERQWVSEHY